MNKEEQFLKIIEKTLSCAEFIGDDCAFLEKFNLVISQDTLVQNVHFSLDTISAYELGKKSLLVNLSDILASGAKPEYLTVSLSGKLDCEFVENFYKGLNEICEKFEVKIVGGDLTGGEVITVSITILGNTKDRQISSRKNAKSGYIVLLLGEHGSSAMGLKLLQSGKKLTEGDKKFVKAHFEPELFPKISEEIARNCNDYAMMDTSDGLYDALKKISEASNAGFDIEYDKITKEVDDFNLVMFGGEDYGLLICVSPDDYNKIKHLNIPKIGIVIEEKEIFIDGKKIREDLRFEHF